MAVLQRLRRGLSSPQQFKILIQTKDVPTEGTAYFNEDLLPTPPGLSYPLSFTVSGGSVLM